jgi:hypothetical protein
MAVNITSVEYLGPAVGQLVGAQRFKPKVVFSIPDYVFVILH